MIPHCLSCIRKGLISEDEALRNADSLNNVRLKIKFAKEDGESGAGGSMGLSLESLDDERPQPGLITRYPLHVRLALPHL